MIFNSSYNRKVTTRGKQNILLLLTVYGLHFCNALKRCTQVYRPCKRFSNLSDTLIHCIDKQTKPAWTTEQDSSAFTQIVQTQNKDEQQSIVKQFVAARFI